MLRLLGFNRPLSLPVQLKWQRAHEPVLAEWSIRARNYNTLAANCGFMVYFALLVGVCVFMYFVFEGKMPEWVRIVSCIYFVLFGSSVMSLGTFPRMSFAYRLTRSGLEYCKWKNFPMWTVTFVNWFSGIGALVCLFFAVQNPAFLIGALVGPGGMGLLAVARLNSKSFQVSQTEFHQRFIRWEHFTSATVASNRALLDLMLDIPETPQSRGYWGHFYVYLDRRSKKEVVAIVKQSMLSDVPWNVAKVYVR